MMVFKGIVVIGMMGFGILAMLTQLGATIPYLKVQSLEAYGLPVGGFILVIGLLVARFWKVSHKSTVTDREVIKGRDGRTTTRTRTIKHERMGRSA